MTEFWLHVDRFFDILFTRNVLMEVLAVAVFIGLGLLVGGALRNRQHRLGAKAPTALTSHYFASHGLLVIAPVAVTLGLVILARGALNAAHYDAMVLESAMRLIGAYLVVRFGVMLFAASLGNQSWMQHLENRLALVIWLVIAAEYLGWLNPIIAGLDSIGIAAGKSRVTVWSVLKLLFTLTLFVLAAAWISRWIDRRLKKLSNLEPSTRIGLAKFANAFLIGLSILMGLNAAGVDL
ncbi:MAG TPA: hypothetical protein VK251_07890, partial [Steroidobacteraceae bacterium]|nr:hypothetical protein [Steroidobacteraceae bacterium]